MHRRCRSAPPVTCRILESDGETLELVLRVPTFRGLLRRLGFPCLSPEGGGSSGGQLGGRVGVYIGASDRV